MASSLLRSISDFLDNGVDECFSLLYDAMPLDSELESSTEETQGGHCSPGEERDAKGEGGRMTGEEEGDCSSPLRRNTSKSVEVR